MVVAVSLGLIVLIIVSIYYAVKMFAGDYKDPIKERQVWYWNIFMLFAFWVPLPFIDFGVTLENNIVLVLFFIFLLLKLIEVTSFYIRAIITPKKLWTDTETTIGRKISEDERKQFLNKTFKSSPIIYIIFFALFFGSKSYGSLFADADQEGKIFLQLAFAVNTLPIVLWYYLRYKMNRFFVSDKM